MHQKCLHAQVPIINCRPAARFKCLLIVLRAAAGTTAPEQQFVRKTWGNRSSSMMVGGDKFGGVFFLFFFFKKKNVELDNLALVPQKCLATNASMISHAPKPKKKIGNCHRLGKRQKAGFGRGGGSSQCKVRYLDTEDTVECGTSPWRCASG